mmetsp:Transcript_27538/g.42169  ORF Transcript_27538/g.42169 Transcript_27538/m.42169 type:complete len:185 (+) Transcript_27538:33-587(+)
MKRSRSSSSNEEVTEIFQDDCWKRKWKSKSSSNCLLISLLVQLVFCASLPLCESFGIGSSSMHSHSSPSIIYSSKTSFLRPMHTYTSSYSSSTYNGNNDSSNDMLTMGKGDGKKKRKKKSASPSVTTAEVAAPAPLRVRNDLYRHHERILELELSSPLPSLFSMHAQCHRVFDTQSQHQDSISH